VFRLALLALSVTVVGLVALALLPQRERTVPAGTVELTNARLTLYPQADPEAVWHFSAERVEYEPDIGETTLYAIRDAERRVGGETDFTLEAERVVIDAQDNLLSDHVEVFILDAEWTLDMRGQGGVPVLIDQGRGRFEAPLLSISGRDIESVSANAGMNFDLTEFSSGGEGTQNRDAFRDRTPPNRGE
jgi:hypothetical protein